MGYNIYVYGNPFDMFGTEHRVVCYIKNQCHITEGVNLLRMTEKHCYFGI